MNTTTGLSPLEAGKIVGKSKATITAALRDGRLSGTKDQAGNWTIEPAELFRLFEPASQEQAIQLAGDKVDQPAQASSSAGQTSGWRAGLEFERLKIELATTTRELEGQREERERERRDKDLTIADLRQRLDDSQEMFRQKDTQLTALLTDQSRKPEPTRGGLFGLLRRASA